MASRRPPSSYGQNWGSTEQDRNNSHYDPQYPDDDAGESVQLDQRRLYITNIPNILNQEGFQAAFSKYGTLQESFINNDPNKRYGLVTFETAGEAKLAMMKLNRTEPLQMCISIAHKQKNKRRNDGGGAGGRERGGRDGNARDRDDRSVASGGRDRRSLPATRTANGADNISAVNMTPVEDDVHLIPNLDPQIAEEFEQLEVARLQAQQAELELKQRRLLRQRSITQNSSTNRCVLPGGRVVVRNVNDGPAEPNPESSFTAGAGDSREGSRACIACGAAAGAFCSRCGVTPYCSVRCQRRDWNDRHHTVCHNLARLAEPLNLRDNGNVESNFPVPASLRRPRSPEGVLPRETVPKVTNTTETVPTRDSVGNKSFGNQPNRNGFGNQSGSQRAGASNQRDQAGGNRKDFGNQRGQELATKDDNFDRTQKRPFPAVGSSSNVNNVKTAAFGGLRTRNNHTDDRNDNRNDNRQADFADGRRPPLRHETRRQNDQSEEFSGKDAACRNYTRGSSGRTAIMQERNQHYCNDEEDWDTPAPKPDRAERTPGPSRPFKESPQPVTSPEPEPVKDTPEPVKDTPEPVKDTPEPVKDTPEPVKDTPEPVKATPEPVKSTPEPVRAASEPAKPAVEKSASNCMAPASLTDVTPAKRKMVPWNCLIETLAFGEVVLLSVDKPASECRAGAGFVCLSMHHRYEADFTALCVEYTTACNADTSAFTPAPGDAFSYLNPQDGAWYRARCLTPSLAALLDSSKLVPLTAGDSTRRLGGYFETVPEFSCLLRADVTVGDNLACTVVAKTPSGIKVSFVNIETEAVTGVGEMSRWVPDVEWPQPRAAAPAPAAAFAGAPAAAPAGAPAAAAATAPAPAAAAAAAASAIPVVPRPEVVAGSSVLLVDAATLSCAFVRPADTAAQRHFDCVLQLTVQHGRSATPLKEPPAKGDVVIGKFTDGVHYRALVKRTNVKLDKYLLEYIEFGNTHVSALADLFPCPRNLDLSGYPPITSQVSLRVDPLCALTPVATAYLDKLKDKYEELILTLPDGSKTAPSGADVILTVAKNKEMVNRRLEQMCTPEWKKIEQRGGDVVETQSVMFNELEYLELPATGCELEILDFSMLHAGTVSGYQRGHPHAQYVFTHLTNKMAQYCDSEIGREPYLPKDEELCIAQCPPYPQWFRAALAERVSGPGSPVVRLCYVDYGNLDEVPVSMLRKMLPEFVRGLPALACSLEIRGFPLNPSEVQLARAALHMQVTDEGRGILRVTRCEKDDIGAYIVDAPELLAAINAN